MHSDRNDIANSCSNIPFNALADHPESLVEVTGQRSSLPGEYSALKECKCCRAYDRTDMDWNKSIKLKEVSLPLGFKSPLDLFETTTSVYLAKQLHQLSEIHIMSLGSGQLLHELIIILKLIKELKANYSAIPKIILHAVDYLYKKKNRTTSDGMLLESSLLCHEQFKRLIKQWNLDVELFSYSSLEKYNQKKIIKEYPEVILSIDLTVQFDVDFPEKSKDRPSQDFKFTQQGILKNTKEKANDGSIYITMTHHDINAGIFIIFEKKYCNNWQKEWIHTVHGFGTKEIKLGPSQALHDILKKREDEFKLSDIYQKEQLEKDRFKSAPLSYAVKEKTYLVTTASEDHLSRGEKEIIQKIDLLLKSENVNAQCQQGFTALHWAAMARDEKMIKKLIFYGADPTIRNSYNRTPMDYYQYQINLSDFNNNFSNAETYQMLVSEYGESDQIIMLEFNQLYINDDEKIDSLSFRNNESIDLSIFNLKNTSENKSTSVPKLSQTQLGLFTPEIELSRPANQCAIQNGYY